MSEYIKSIEQDYNDGKVSLEKLDKLREGYNKLSAYDKRTLDLEHKSKNKSQKNTKSESIVNHEVRIVELLDEQNSKLSSIKGILQFFLVLTILSILGYIYLFLDSI